MAKAEGEADYGSDAERDDYENMRSDIEHAAVTTDPYTYQYTDEEADDPKHVDRTVAADEAPAVIVAAVHHAAAIATEQRGLLQSKLSSNDSAGTAE